MSSETATRGAECHETIIIGGGQAGLAAGYYLARQRRPFVILDANGRTGDSWRQRWDSLRLFTPARFDGLPGMRYPGPRHVAPTKDEFADYLEAYAARFQLPVRRTVKVERLHKSDGRFVVTAGDARFEAETVIVATGGQHTATTPSYARELDARIIQLHSSDYRDPSQLRAGGVLLAGAGNSGADIALEVARTHQTWLSGNDTGHIPFRIDGLAGRYLVRVVRFIGHRVLTRGTPIGRRVLPHMAGKGGPLVRVKPQDIVAAGVARVPRVSGVHAGQPLLEDGQVLDVANVIWCTGYRCDFAWIDLPIFGEDSAPLHQRGVIDAEPGIYFLGLPFLYAATSDVITGVGRDAAHVVKHLARRQARARAGSPSSQRSPAPSLG